MKFSNLTIVAHYRGFTVSTIGDFITWSDRDSVKCPRLKDLSLDIERYTRSGEVAPLTV